MGGLDVRWFRCWLGRVSDRISIALQDASHLKRYSRRKTCGLYHALYWMHTDYDETGHPAHIEMCAHTHSAIHLDVDGVQVEVTATVSRTLSISVLLGTDVPQLAQLFHPSL